MPLTYNGNAPAAVTYNSNALQKVTRNGVTVWQAAPASNDTEVTISLPYYETFGAFYITQSAPNAVTIDWGDGSPTETSANLAATFFHEYDAVDATYTVKFSCAEGETWSAGQTGAGFCEAMFDVHTTAIKCGSGMRFDVASGVKNVPSLTSVTFSNEITSIANGCFQASGLTSVVLPAVQTIGGGAFVNNPITSVDLGDSVTSIAGAAFGQTSLVLTSFICRATAPPTIFNNTFNTTATFDIYVPSGSVAAYQAAPFWSARAAYIQAIP